MLRARSTLADIKACWDKIVFSFSERTAQGINLKKMIIQRGSFLLFDSTSLHSAQPYCSELLAWLCPEITKTAHFKAY